MLPTSKKQREEEFLALDRTQVEFLVKLRDAHTMAAEAVNDYLETFAPKEEKTAVNEEIFSILKFEPQQGTKLGSYDVAYKANNPTDSWTQTFDILSKASATIQARYHGKDYQFSYWLYGEGKIYRQKLKGVSSH
jgi:hypothetical protein